MAPAIPARSPFETPRGETPVLSPVRQSLLVVQDGQGHKPRQDQDDEDAVIGSPHLNSPRIDRRLFDRESVWTPEPRGQGGCVPAPPSQVEEGRRELGVDGPARVASDGSMNRLRR